MYVTQYTFTKVISLFLYNKIMNYICDYSFITYIHLQLWM
ncbi:hypothetical protein M104_2390 [Bacteroides fragilis str. 1007-1-F |uniref:Uncharacterized protein n=2 Tax=Bacteroides fragilis TaxID=817 RepID=A0A016APH5_BACFG|nr:hypothetical protein M147_2563 [Bacteroides fragilis str. 1007-1-F \